MSPANSVLPQLFPRQVGGSRPVAVQPPRQQVYPRVTHEAVGHSTG